ncbi:MAG: phosphatase PAP2 family protein [Bacteroidota bacterium]|nr:phosphatase PAP2 family protein [Bacteroidota bacterium]
MEQNRILSGVSLLLFAFTCTQAQSNDSTSVPLTKLFYHIDKHVAGSFTYNNGLNHILAAALSFGIVKSGLDWKVNRAAYNDRSIAHAGLPAVEVGGTAPVLIPIGLLIYGKVENNNDLQNAALALGQAAVISVVLSSAYKAITGRRPPGILHGEGGDSKNYSGDFKFGFLNRGVYNGWPSSHTMNAFALAATLSELYPNATALKTAAFAYASLVGLGVSVNIHWFSDAVAGALIGYSIGKVVGADFRNETKTEPPVGFHLTPSGVSFTYSF